MLHPIFMPYFDIIIQVDVLHNIGYADFFGALKKKKKKAS